MTSCRSPGGALSEALWPFNFTMSSRQPSSINTSTIQRSECYLQQPGGTTAMGNSSCLPPLELNLPLKSFQIQLEQTRSCSVTLREFSVFYVCQNEDGWSSSQVNSKVEHQTHLDSLLSVPAEPKVSLLLLSVCTVPCFLNVYFCMRCKYVA